MKKIVLALFFFACSFLSVAQTWAWAKAGFGGSEGLAVCTDTAGNVFITGEYVGQIVFDTYTLTSSAVGAVYIVKYDPNGNVAWARTSISTAAGSDSGYGISTDNLGNVLVTGPFSSSLIAFGTNSLTNSGTSNIFLVKYDTNGNVLWARSAGGTSFDFSNAARSDMNGNTYIAGFFTSPTAVFGTYSLTNSATRNSFLAKYDAAGNVVWARTSIASFKAVANNCGLDGLGNIYVAGYFDGSTVAFGTNTLTNNGNHNAFITKYDANGNVLWAKSAGGNYYDYAWGVSGDQNGNAYVCGQYTSPSITFGAITLTNTSNAFLVKYDANGNTLWARSTSYGGFAYSVSTSTLGVFICGPMSNTIISTGTQTMLAPSISGDPVFFARYDANGNDNYLTALSGGGDDEIEISVDACNLYVSGDYLSNPLIVGTYSLANPGGEPAYTAKLSFSCGTQPDLIIENIADEHAFIYPNPTKGKCRVKLNSTMDGAQFSLINLLGEKMFEQKIGSTDTDTEVELSSLKSGIYIFLLSSNGNELRKGKIIIE